MKKLLSISTVLIVGAFIFTMCTKDEGPDQARLTAHNAARCCMTPTPELRTCPDGTYFDETLKVCAFRYNISGAYSNTYFVCSNCGYVTSSTLTSGNGEMCLTLMTNARETAYGAREVTADVYGNFYNAGAGLGEGISETYITQDGRELVNREKAYPGYWDGSFSISSTGGALSTFTLKATPNGGDAQF